MKVRDYIVVATCFATAIGLAVNLLATQPFEVVDDDGDCLYVAVPSLVGEDREVPCGAVSTSIADPVHASYMTHVTEYHK